MSKTKELVVAGHALVKELHCAESAALVRELAMQLDVQCARADALAVENVGLNKFIDDECYVYGPHYVEPVDAATEKPETPATDRFVAEMKAQYRAEGINYAAGRCAAAFNHGFIDKPMKEVGDVVRMILDTKAELADSPEPADDGLSGDYAEKSLKDWEEQLREVGQ
ncbi:hypothetical protein [Scandinavium sp.]|uniref:hypothetical protein n=1 Tax=Scandinavium sp. TaxID=2830653 RepID=UPI00390C5643